MREIVYDRRVKDTEKAETSFRELGVLIPLQRVFQIEANLDLKNW